MTAADSTRPVSASAERVLLVGVELAADAVAEEDVLPADEPVEDVSLPPESLSEASFELVPLPALPALRERRSCARNSGIERSMSAIFPSSGLRFPPSPAIELASKSCIACTLCCTSRASD